MARLTATFVYALLLSLGGVALSPVRAAPAAAAPPLPAAATVQQTPQKPQTQKTPQTLQTPPTAAPPEEPAQPASDPLLNLLAERGLLRSGLASLQPAVTLANQARDLASEAVIGAMAFLGRPYAWGGSTAESGFDCSGFTRFVFNNTLGLLLPRSAEQQAQMHGMQPVAADELKPGDLVFFNTLRRAFSHVGIYVGDGRFVHSPREGAVVRLENMRQAYWSTRFDGARRPPLQAATQAQPNADTRR